MSMICNYDCLKCKYDDCINEKIDDVQIYVDDLMDRKISKDVDMSTRSYRYNHSSKKKEADKRYGATDKGKEAKKRSYEKYLKEYPERALAKSKLYYRRHREEILERARLKRIESIGCEKDRK